MQWNRCYPCHHDIELVIIHSILARSSSFLRSLCLCTFAFCSISIATMFAHLCLQLRSSTASWCRASFVSQRSLCGNASDLSLSLFISSPSFSLWFHDTCHLMPFTQYSLLDQFYFFTSCLSIAHLKFTNKIHQLFTDYLLRLPYSELLETHLFRSRANRRLVLKRSSLGTSDIQGCYSPKGITYMIYTLIHGRDPIPWRITYIEFRSAVKIFINF